MLLQVLLQQSRKHNDFVNELWKLNPPTGLKRYYDGCLLFFALLHCSGNFKIWGAVPSNTPTPVQTPTNTPTNTPKDTPTPSTIAIDVNGDHAINMSDVMLVASCFNTALGDGKYNSKYDINKDNAINMSDIMLIAAKFNTIY
jgi:hypothetical protein